MIIAVDIGGTKTLVAVIDNHGKIINQQKFLTPQNYHDFLDVLTDTIRQLYQQTPNLIIVAIPGKINRVTGEIIVLGNLPWTNQQIVNDISKMTNNCPVIIENDANLAALSEANLLKNVNQKVIYITFSTGVGTGFVVNGRLDPELLDSESGHMVFAHDGKLMDWEDFASGHAIVEKYGKMASELEDPAAWREIADNMAIGIVDNTAIFAADTIIIGGGVGTHFKKYGHQLQEAVDSLLKTRPTIKRPRIIGAQQAEEAVILGCIILAKQHDKS